MTHSYYLVKSLAKGILAFDDFTPRMATTVACMFVEARTVEEQWDAHFLPIPETQGDSSP